MKIGDRVFVRGYIDEIRKDTVIVRNDGGYFGTIPSEVITGELPSAQPEQQWIPWDSGKFPKESGTYTVTAYDGATKRVTYAKYQKRLKRWELTGARAYWRVLAWMPLPEPYKEDDHEG